MPRSRRRRRCSHCGSLDTRRHGKKVLKRQRSSGSYVRRKRWYCKQCRRTFMQVVDAGPSWLDQRAIELYFDAGASYRSVSRLLKMRPMTVYHRVIQMGLNSKSPMEVTQELNPHWSGYLVVDGDAIHVGDHKESLLLGVDSHSQDVPHAILADCEDGMNWTHFFLVLKHYIDFCPKGIVSDGFPAVALAIRAVYPELPWQLCVKHFEIDLERLVRYRFTQKRGYWRVINRFLRHVHDMIYARSIQEAKIAMSALYLDPGFNRAGLAEVIEEVKKRFPHLVTHHFHPGMPRTTSIAEGVISRLDSKINQADGYGHHRSCWATLKMLIVWYRFKKFTDCRKKNRYKNGKSPLQLAGVDTSKINWIKFSQKSL